MIDCSEPILRMSLLRRPAQAAARYLAIVVLAVAAVSVSASSADAASSTTCTGTSVVTYSPGLTFTPQAVSYTITDTYISCTSIDTSLTAGGFSLNFSAASLSCLPGASISPLPTYTISWNNSQSSTVTLTTMTDVFIAGIEQVTGVGTITSGEFTGGVITVVVLYPPVNPLQCLTSQGFITESGTVTLEIIVTP